MSRLTPGIPQVPIKSISSLATTSDLVMTALKNHQNVVILKCESNPKARLLHLSRLLINDAANRNVKIKVVATLKAGRQPKDYAELLSNDRNETLTTTIGKYLRITPKCF